MATIIKDLGVVTAYAYAVAGGYVGTEAQFETLLGNIAGDLEQIENLTVTVTTLPAGSDATASYSDGVLALGIPQGEKGETGATGQTGATGATGNGIASIEKTGTSGNVDTYTITYTNGQMTTFTVTNGNVTSVAGKTGAVTLDAGDVAFSDAATYSSGTVGNAVSSLKSEITQSVDDINTILFKDGDAAMIQRVTAETVVPDSPKEWLHVESTDKPIYTGKLNMIDLFGLKQGTFTDTNSGVVIEITGNEIYIHGSPSSGFRFNLQTGEFYTDSFANHPADFSNLPTDHVQYQFMFWEKSGYTMPTNVYFGVLSSGGTISAVNLSGHVNGLYPDLTNQYVAIYSNGAISNLDVKFTIGFRLKACSSTTYNIEATAKSPYDTTIITKPGYYKADLFTWTSALTTCSVKHTTLLVHEDPLMVGRVFAWFGDSLSQLRELPPLVSELLGITIYDCSFAGAPLTYGDPTKYQPTGFMSLASQIVAGDFSDLSDALDAQQAAGVNVTEKRAHMATLEALDFDNVTDIVIFAGTNDFDNDYVTATNFVNGFSSALTTLLTAYPHLMVYVFAPTWRGDKNEGVESIPTMPDLIELEKQVADAFSLPFYDLYHRSGINSLTQAVYLESDHLHPSVAGDTLLANKCAKFLRSN